MTAQPAPEKPKCCAAIRNKGCSEWRPTYHACGKAAKFERDGKHYCGTHDPVACENKRKASQGKWEQDRANERKARTRAQVAAEYHDALVLVLRDILGALPDSRNWLNPDTERTAKAILAEIEAKSK